MIENLKNSPKTTAGGVLALLALIFTVLTAQFDGVEETVPDWGQAATMAAVVITAFFARDNNVSSEDAGAK